MKFRIVELILILNKYFNDFFDSFKLSEFFRIEFANEIFEFTSNFDFLFVDFSLIRFIRKISFELLFFMMLFLSFSLIWLRFKHHKKLKLFFFHYHVKWSFARYIKIDFSTFFCLSFEFKQYINNILFYKINIFV